MNGALALRQTLALFVDAVRRLRAAKLFWIALGLSLLVSGLFGIVSINAQGLHILIYGQLDLPGLSTDVIDADAFYKILFLTLGVGIWLAWAAIILALISTADLIPSLIADGSADLYLSRPLNRIRLLLTRYATGLLFVAAQAACFAVASILVIKLRGGIWLPGLLWTIPMVVIFFSLLYCISSLVGLLTGSSIAAILITLLVWFLSWGVDTADQVILQQREQARELVTWRNGQLEFNREQAYKFRNASEVAQSAIVQNEEPLREAVARAEERYQSWWNTHRILMWVKAPLPKTGETLAVLRRQLVSAADLDSIGGDFDEERERRAIERAERRGEDVEEAVAEERAEEVGESEADKRYVNRPLWWSIGTSFAFQGVMLGIACIVFARRDL